jgi:hypothetical protein
VCAGLEENNATSLSSFQARHHTIEVDTVCFF